MIPVVKKASPAAIAILKQATAICPKRSRVSDGLLPSPAHQLQNPNSDHNTGLAADLTHDPANGVDCTYIMEQLKADPRVKYLIHNGLIWVAREANKGNQPYIGQIHTNITYTFQSIQNRQMTLALGILGRNRQ